MVVLFSYSAVSSRVSSGVWMILILYMVTSTFTQGYQSSLLLILFLFFFLNPSSSIGNLFSIRLLASLTILSLAKIPHNYSLTVQPYNFPRHYRFSTIDLVTNLPISLKKYPERSLIQFTSILHCLILYKRLKFIHLYTTDSYPLEYNYI